MRDRLNRIRKGGRVLPHKILELLQTPDVDARSRLAMADHVPSEKFIERLQLTAVHAPETSDQGLVLFAGRAHCGLLHPFVPAPSSAALSGRRASDASPALSQRDVGQ